MRSHIHDKKISTPGILFGDPGFLIRKSSAPVRAMRNRAIGKAFASKIMLVVAAVNGCTPGAWLHARKAVTCGMSADEIRDMSDPQFAASATAHEPPALLFAQRHAETGRRRDPAMTAQPEKFFSADTADDIMLLIRRIFFGNVGSSAIIGRCARDARAGS